MNSSIARGSRCISFSENLSPKPMSVPSALWVVGASLLIALCAQITIPLPFTPVPLTGSTFGVLYAAALLGPRRGLTSVGLYLVLGVLGFPFFAGASSGWHVLLGAPGGYLIGFIPASYLVGLLSERGWDRDPLTAFSQMMLGSFVILAFGLVVLSLYVSKGTLLAKGFYPFLIGDVLKSILAAGLLPLGWRLTRKK
jgi:biotin transport system substrate-specific component